MNELFLYLHNPQSKSNLNITSFPFSYKRGNAFLDSSKPNNQFWIPQLQLGAKLINYSITSYV